MHQVPAHLVVAHAYGEEWTHRCCWKKDQRTTSSRSNKNNASKVKEAQSIHQTKRQKIDRKDNDIDTDLDERNEDDANVDRVKITFYDANHCPGAAIVVFQLPGKQEDRIHLHTGDMRYHPKMKTYPLLQQAAKQKQVDLVFLDSTYGNPRHDFCAQEQAVDVIATHVEGLLGKERASENRTLVLLSCYSIGKERVLWETSQRTNQPVFVQERKHLMLQCIHEQGADHDNKHISEELQHQTHASSSIIERCTQDATQSDIHVIPMGMAGEMWPFFQPNHWGCAEYAREINKQRKQQYDKVVAFLPTGWAEASNWNKKNGVSRKHCNGIDVEVRLVAYSEHSSFVELQEFVNFLKPRKIVPTVFKDENDKRKIQARFKVDSQRAKQMFLQSFGGGTTKASSASNQQKKSRKSLVSNSICATEPALNSAAASAVEVIDLTDGISDNFSCRKRPALAETTKSSSSSASKNKKQASSSKSKSSSPLSITDFFKVKKKAPK